MRFATAFSLLEVMMVLLIMTLALSTLAIPLAAQVQLRRFEETRRLLDQARDAILGFAAAHGRLPCPASAASRGLESFAPGADAASGICSGFHDGFVPAATLGLSPLDGEGYVRDPWDTPRNRLRYAVFGGSINGVAQPLTRTNGMQAATLPALGAASHYLFICSTGALADGSGCGPAANQLTRRAAFVLHSAGANAIDAPAAGSDEARNQDADAVFVSRDFSSRTGHEFDDIVQWVAMPIIVNRLVLAGRLP